MNKATLPRAIDLPRALQNADLDELDAAAEEIGRQAIANALAEQSSPTIERFKSSDEDERQRQLDAAFGDAIEIVNRHRIRLGRRVCSASDARVTRQVFELIRSMADATGGADNDASFQ